ncbi:hypothetical protein [Roseobacter sp. OBYS 0001]|uniref:hypothetical protein n=1 Tax=Roseobacter sp. OBYS 0001 TaxID=882651 RepID=UPI001BBE38CB|nr:hypothetical protein [Roseobacter sp. OBYS 0001]GIT86982.1 hypothetical protein ROBYS_19980 [Roseobacter sp. OBYS 0001]
MSNLRTISKTDLVKAYQVSAKLVARYGIDFVPAFERMEIELQRLNEIEEAIGRAENAVEHKTPIFRSERSK